MKLFKLKPLTSKALLIGLGLLLLRFAMLELVKQQKLDSIEEQEERKQVEIDSNFTHLLSKNSIEDVDDLVKYLKVGGYLGTNFDTIALRIFNKVETLPTIDTEVRNKAIKFYSDKLDELPYLDGADIIKDALLKDFTSEFDSIFSIKILELEAK